MSRISRGNINWLKTTYLFSVIVTLLSGATILYSVHQGHFLDLVLMTPVLAVFYPIALIGTLGYSLKRTLKKKSIFDLLQMGGGGNGISNIMSGLGESVEEEDDQEEKEVSE